MQLWFTITIWKNLPEVPTVEKIMGNHPATENEACVMAREETFNMWKIITPTFQFYVFMCVYVCADHESHPLAGPHPAWGHHHPALQFPEGQGYSGYPENDENHR